MAALHSLWQERADRSTVGSKSWKSLDKNNSRWTPCERCSRLLINLRL